MPTLRNRSASGPFGNLISDSPEPGARHLLVLIALLLAVAIERHLALCPGRRFCRPEW